MMHIRLLFPGVVRPVRRSAALISLFLSLLVAAPVTAQRPAPTPERLFAEAYQQYSRQLFEQAAEGFARFREAFPEHLSVAEALYYEAQAMLAVGQEAQAVRLFEQFHRRYPAHPLAYQARLALGKYFYDTAQYERAIEILDRVLADNPTSEIGAKALYWRAEALIKLERYDEALATYTRTADRYPGASTSPMALLAAGFTQVQMDRHQDAALTFERLTQEYPNSQYVRNVGLALAEAYYELGKYQETISEIELRMNGLDASGQQRARFLLAESYNHLRQSDAAIRNYRWFTEGDAKGEYHRPARYGLGWNYYADRRYDLAAAQFAVLRSGQKDGLAELGTYYEAVNRRLAGDPRAAVPIFTAYITTWPEGSLIEQARFELGLTQYELEEFAAAVQTFDAMARAHPESDLLPKALQMQANAQIALGKYDAALRSFDRGAMLKAASDSLKEEILFERAWMLYRIGAYASASPSFLSLYQQRADGARGADALFWAAESAFQSGSYQNAERLYQDYLRVFRSGKYRVAAQYALGWIYFKQQNYPAAINSFQQFLAGSENRQEVDTYRSDALLRLGDSYLALKQYSEAIRAYERVTGVARDYALYQIGQAHLNSENAQAGIRAFQQLLKDYPRSEWAEEAQYGIGYLHFINQDYEAAVRAYRRLIEAAPRDVLAARAQYAIGDAYFNAGNYTAAAEAYRIVLDQYSGSPYATGANERVQEALYAVAATEPVDPKSRKQAETELDPQALDEIQYREAVRLYRSGRLGEALDAFASYVRQTKESRFLPDAYYYQGEILAEQGNTAEAVPMLRRVMDAYANSPRHLDASLRLGQLYIQNERHGEALAVLRGIETSADEDDLLALARARYGQSLALIELERGEEAIDILQEVIDEATNSPDVVPAMLGIARVYDSLNRIDRAAEAYRAVVRRSHDEFGAEAQYRLGVMLLQRGDPGTGALELSRLPALFGAYPEWVARGFLAHARTLRDLGQHMDANRLYDRIARDYRGTAVAQTAAREKSAL